MRDRDYGGLDGVFWAKRPMIGMVHLKPLPGSPRDAGSGMEAILAEAVADAQKRMPQVV